MESIEKTFLTDGGSLPRVEASEKVITGVSGVVSVVVHGLPMNVHHWNGFWVVMENIGAIKASMFTCGCWVC